MTRRDSAQAIAACLGLDEAQILRLQARGYLLTLNLSKAEIHERLYRAHCRYLGLPNAAERFGYFTSRRACNATD